MSEERYSITHEEYEEIRRNEVPPWELDTCECDKFIYGAERMIKCLAKGYLWHAPHCNFQSPQSKHCNCGLADIREAFRRVRGFDYEACEQCKAVGWIKDDKCDVSIKCEICNGQGVIKIYE